MKRSCMKKFLLILSCFLAETCVIEKNVVVALTPEISYAEVMTEQETIKNIEFNKLRCSKTLYQSMKNAEDFVLNYCTPHSSQIIKELFIDNNLLEVSEEQCLYNAATILQNIKQTYNLSDIVLDVALFEGRAAAAYGHLWNLAVDIKKAGHMLNSQTEKKNGIYIHAPNPWVKICKILDELILLFRFNLDRVADISRMNSNDQYAYTQYIGGLTYYIGPEPIIQKLEENLYQAINNNRTDLLPHLLEQIRNVYIWAISKDSKNAKKVADLVQKHNQLYQRTDIHPYIQPYSKNYLLKESSLKAQENPEYNYMNELDVKLKSLFDSINVNHQLTPTQTKMGNTINFKKVNVVTPGLGGKIKSGLTMNSCFAISGLAPLLARGLIADPRLELNIMDTSYEKQTKINFSEYGELVTASNITCSHFGYLPLLITSQAIFGHHYFLNDSFHPFLPMYLVEFRGQHYEIICRSLYDMKLKEELQTRLINNGITNELVEAYQNNFIKYSTQYQLYQLTKSLCFYIMNSGISEIPNDLLSNYETVHTFYKNSFGGDDTFKDVCMLYQSNLNISEKSEQEFKRKKENTEKRYKFIKLLFEHQQFNRDHGNAFQSQSSRYKKSESMPNLNEYSSENYQQYQDGLFLRNYYTKKYGPISDFYEDKWSYEDIILGFRNLINLINKKINFADLSTSEVDEIKESLTRTFPTTEKITPEQLKNIQIALDTDACYKNQNKNISQLENNALGTQRDINIIKKEIQDLVNEIAFDPYFQATQENALDPFHSIFSQRTDNFIYRVGY